jgi:hypothetical protein
MNLMNYQVTVTQVPQLTFQIKELKKGWYFEVADRTRSKDMRFNSEAAR